MNDQQSHSLNYRNISFLIRPARAVILLPEHDEYWKHSVLSIIECNSKVWGGAYFLIIPTDGDTIKECFWKILEEYCPDYFIAFRPTVYELISANPKVYKDILERHEIKLGEQNAEIDNDQMLAFIDRINRLPRMDFEIDDDLQKQIITRLSPFRLGEHAIEGWISAQQSISYPLTQIEKIAKQGGLETVYVVQEIGDIDHSLSFFSNWGIYGEDFIEVLSKIGIRIETTPDNANRSFLFKTGINKQVDRVDLHFLQHFDHEAGREIWYPPEDIFSFSPYEASLLQVNRYYSSSPGFNDEPAILIIGDAIEDYCLYFCLSRYQNVVYWLPEVKNPDVENLIEDDPRLFLCSEVVHAIFDQLTFRGRNRKLHIASLSLSNEDLESCKSNISRLLKNLDNFIDRIVIEDTPWILNKNTLRLIEKNNYTSSYAEVFKDDHSIGRLPTPKPKNFSQIDPYEHRWVTEFTIEGYTPPQLHFLGNQIVKLAGSTQETRISKTGICYFCPNIAYFGGDIDVTLVRPRINLVETFEIYREYFENAGYTEIRISDKGHFSKQAISIFGSLDEVGACLFKKQNSDMLLLFQQKETPSNPENGEIVFVNKRAYVDFKAIAQKLESEESAISIIDQFISKGVFYRGLIFQCDFCKGSDWYGLNELDQSFACHRCSRRQIIKHHNWKEDKEPKLYYKLDEVIYQGINNGMILPLITLARLKKNSTRSFLHAPELEFWRKRSKHEVDICCIQDGRIVLGECRTGRIDKAIIDKLKRIAISLTPLPDRLIFSTLCPVINDEIIEYAKSNLPIPFRFLTISELYDS